MSTAVVEFDTRIGHGRPTRPPRAGSEPSVRPTRSQRPAVSTVRLTRRGRLVVFLGGMTLALAAFIWVGAPAASTGEEHHQVTQTVVVAPGQTLWDIAAEVAPDEDPRVVIADIVDLNALADAGAVRAGQPLYVPAY